jgi:hypothetical protein
MKKNILLLIGLCFLFLNLYSQYGDDQKTLKRFKISIVPQHLLINAVRVDFEMINKKNISLLVTPQFYLRAKSDVNVTPIGGSNEYSSLIGGGIDIFNKVSFQTSTYPVYFAIGGGYNYFNIGFKDNIWTTYTSYGNTFYRYDLTDLTQQIHRINFGMLYGLEAKFLNFMFVDLYIGLGVKYSISSFDNELYNINNFNKTMIDFGFTGVVFLAGVKFGIIF